MKYISFVQSAPGSLRAVGIAPPRCNAQKPWIIVDYRIPSGVDIFEVDFLVIPR